MWVVYVLQCSLLTWCYFLNDSLFILLFWKVEAKVFLPLCLSLYFIVLSFWGTPQILTVNFLTDLFFNLFVLSFIWPQNHPELLSIAHLLLNFCRLLYSSYFSVICSTFLSHFHIFLGELLASLPTAVNLKLPKTLVIFLKNVYI